jgi:ABC-type multidrug transport system ATPase subunit
MPADSPPAPALQVSSLTVRRGGRPVVRGVSLDVLPGEVVAVIGPNGAGKSSLLEAVVGEAPATGQVRVNGRLLRRLPERAEAISWMPDDADPAPELSVAGHLAFAQLHGRPPAGVGAALARGLGLESLEAVPAGELSRGEKRRLSLFTALCTRCPVVVLDEPLGAFDPLQLLGVCDLLRERARAGAALLLSVHQMSDAEKIASRVLLLDGGEVVAFGPLQSLRERAGLDRASLEDVFLGLLKARRADAPA